MNKNMARRGIDISAHQGDINLSALKNQIDFVIIRVGYGVSGTIDTKFKRNTDLCVELGIPFGFYWYSYALDESGAKKEAEACINAIAPYKDKYSMGIWFDMEDADGYKDRNGFTDRQELTDCVNVFVNHMAEKGYRCGLYSNYDWLTNVLYMEQIDCDVWCAQYNYECDYPNAAIWQYSDCEKINGQSFDADETIDFE